MAERERLNSSSKEGDARHNQVKYPIPDRSTSRVRDEAARLYGTEIPFGLVKYPQFPFSDRKVTAEHDQRSLLFAFRHERKCP